MRCSQPSFGVARALDLVLRLRRLAPCSDCAACRVPSCVRRALFRPRSAPSRYSASEHDLGICAAHAPRVPFCATKLRRFVPPHAQSPRGPHPQGPAPSEGSLPPSESWRRRRKVPPSSESPAMAGSDIHDGASFRRWRCLEPPPLSESPAIVGLSEDDGASFRRWRTFPTVFIPATKPKREGLSYLGPDTHALVAVVDRRVSLRELSTGRSPRPSRSRRTCHHSEHETRASSSSNPCVLSRE